MSDYIFDRYSRQIFMDEVGVTGQRKIMEARVLVVGAGGLGSPVLHYLAAAGVGKLAVVDFDEVELHNLNRQILHDESAVGRPKVESAHQRIRAVNASIDFVSYHEKLTSSNSGALFSGYDIIVDCSDNFQTRYLINDTCVRLNKILVYGSIVRFEGQLAVFNHEGGKNLRDIFPDIPDSAQDCDTMGVLGPLPGVVGAMMAMEVLKVIVGLNTLKNQLLAINLLSYNISLIQF